MEEHLGPQDKTRWQAEDEVGCSFCLHNINYQQNIGHQWLLFFGEKVAMLMVQSNKGKKLDTGSDLKQ